MKGLLPLLGGNRYNMFCLFFGLNKQQLIIINNNEVSERNEAHIFKSNFHLFANCSNLPLIVAMYLSWLHVFLINT